MQRKTLREVERTLVEQHGEDHAARIRLGIQQVSDRWRESDGDDETLAAFVLEHFLSDEEALDRTAEHFEYAMEMLDGHLHEIQRELSRFQVLDEEPMQPLDGLLAAYSPTAHVSDDLFRSKIAFVALLNFPLTTLEERLRDGPEWSRQIWALSRLTERFEYRLPAEVLQRIEQVVAQADRYIDGYDIHVGRLAGPEGPAGFEPDKALISHWGLRDEIRAQYGQPDGLPRQRLLAQVMERIITSEIPQAVIGSGELEWDPVQNQVRADAGEAWRTAEREPDRRYEHLLSVYRAYREVDPHFPSLPTHMARSFALDREIPEGRMRAMLEGVLESETAKRVGELVRQRLGRPLEPFDLWYAGFRPQAELDEAELDRIVRERYPTAGRFQSDIPRILARLGFAPETAQFVAERIVVDPARGAGHAAGAQRRDDKAHLRTRIGPRGMDYKGFNVAIHELGHNVEQVLSMSRIDHTLLEGVPNTGFTEAFAFLFQARDLELLGQAPPAGDVGESLRVLDRFWSTFEIGGVALLDLEIWHWMYAHPDATPGELREAVVSMASGLWNRFYAPVFGSRDAVLPAIYSHIVAYALYTPDYPLGYLITAQVEEYVKSRELAVEMERMCRLGRLAPDVWMQQAIGQDVSNEALIAAADRALDRLG
ncbi:MAG: hypothetical protein JRI23_26880 [Deltaproteobacteria bacterium]|jgi:hypothetical protein|nr:hypothetical protein [Deltaproteobacteria bacterium]MBW2535686.1 hypothetical protein [Deltaproteobacteria bacterium]